VTGERILGCRAVLILTGLLLLLMPFADHLSGCDRILQGGPDPEFGVLCLLLFAGLVLLMAHRAAASSFLLSLLAHRPIAFPLRFLLLSVHPSSPMYPQARSSEGTPPILSPLSGTPLRI
jgi:hypothetical protein